MLTLTPAYGRDYKSAKEVKTAWSEGKDFVINQMMHPYDGKYINLQDAKTERLTVGIRYKKLTQIVVIKNG